MLVQSDPQLAPVHGFRVVAPLHVSGAKSFGYFCQIRSDTRLGVTDFEYRVSRKQMSQIIAFVCDSFNKKEPFSGAGGSAAAPSDAPDAAVMDMVGQG